ncbi:tetratricopeptide repeat-containing sensor histidine kinase [Cyclobacterium salsum]|uniref:tetratricopeptide repeat-containing sensor histidine kinase n=1 Tax=Cyclobacterium salsum TaxID=2666329 RepID=UPI0013908BB3|nr:ATP-binding protein [Cyclobacterium salsum]
MRFTMGLFFLGWVIFLPARSSGSSYSDSLDSLLQQASSLQYDNTDMAFSLTQQARELLAGNQEPLPLARLNNREATLHYISGNYNRAQYYFALAKEFGERADSKKEIVYAINGRALIQMVDKEYPKALQLLEECIAINQEMRDSISLAKNHFNRGIAYDEMSQYDQSLDNLTQALAYLKADSLSVLTLMVKNRMGKVFHQLGKGGRAEDLFREVLAAESILTNWEKSFALSGLAAIKLERGELEEALNDGEQALEIAEIHGAHWDLQQITGLLSRIYQELGMFDQAYYHLKAHKSHSDSLYDAAKARQMARLELKLTQADNQRLRAEMERDQTMIQQQYKLMGFLVLLLFLMGSILYFFSKHLRLKDKFNRSLSNKNKAIGEQKERITQQNLALKELNSTRTRLLSIISHDLRSPINGIKQLLDVRTKNLLSETEEQEVLCLLSDQIQTTENLLNDLLQWANTQMDGMVAEPVEVNVAKMIERIMQQLEFQTRAKFLVIDHHRDQEIQPVALVDKNHFKIIIQNLLGNAIKFTPEYGKIEIFYTVSDQNISIHIKDSGVGIDEAHQDLINGGVDVRIPSKVGTHDEKGTGLGLLLVKQFLALNGGKMDVTSVPGAGTRFILYFKRRKI